MANPITRPTITRQVSLVAAAIFAAVATVAAPQTARSAIRCDGPYQIIKGVGRHASPYCENTYLANIANSRSPYCENTYLANIANSRGIRVSAKAVRNNPSVKAEVCRAIGFDARVRDICAGNLPESRHRF